MTSTGPAPSSSLPAGTPSSPLSDAPTILASPTNVTRDSSDASIPPPAWLRCRHSAPTDNTVGGNDGTALFESAHSGGDDNLFRSSSPTPSSVLAQEEKLYHVLQALRSVDWSFEKFVRVWTGAAGGRELHLPRAHPRYRSRASRVKAFGRALQSVQSSGVLPRARTLIEECCSELDSIVESQVAPFSRWKEDMDLEKMDYRQVIGTIAKRAPRWYELLQAVLHNSRSGRPSYVSDGKWEHHVEMRIFAMTGQACFSRARNSASAFPASIGVYLLGSGCPRRVVETMAGFGFCHSYHHLNGLFDRVSKHAMDQLAKLKDDPQTVVAYDNINFMDRKRDEQAGHGVEQQSFTNAMLVHCDELPEAGLTQDMHDPSVPLRLRDIVLSPGIQDSDDVGVRLTRFHIADAIKRVHKDTVDAVFKGSKAFPTFPFLDRLPAKKTPFWQFAGITANEGTIEGTYKVHDDIYLRQLRMNAASHPTGLDDFTTRLYLAHGDQLTVHHIRAVQQEQRRASRAYDRRQWLRGVPAWFHIQMNLLNTLVRTHFAPPVPGQSAVHSILADSTLWSRSVNTRDGAKYHLTEPIVAQGFSGRVTAMFYAILQRRGLLSPSVGGRKEDIEEAIKGLSPDDFNLIVDEVQHSAFTKAAWDDTASDIDYRTQCRMLQEVELFLTLRHAVKHGDIGMLRRLVDPLTVVFFGASQHNYGREMLYLRWMLSDANTSELQRAILGSSLVNWLGRSNTFKPIDLALEHLNCNLKIDLRNFKNSTHDIAIAFQRGALCNTWMRGLKYTMETTYGESMSGKHSRASVVADMFLLAWQTWVGGYSHPRPASSGDSRAAQFDSIDLYRLGMDVLESRVAQFNQTYVTHVAAPFILLEPDDDGFVYIDDIHPYASLVSDRYDGVEDLVLDLPRPPVIEDPVTDPIADAVRTRQHSGLGDGSDVETMDLS